MGELLVLGSAVQYSFAVVVVLGCPFFFFVFVFLSEMAGDTKKMVVLGGGEPP